MKVFGLALALGVALLTHVVPASAATIALTVSGVVNSVGAPGASQFSDGDTFTFKMLLDNTVPDVDGDPTVGDYYGFKQFSGSFSNGYAFTGSTPSSLLRVMNDTFPYPDGDYAYIVAGSPSAPDVNGFFLFYAELGFHDAFGAMINSAAIPGDFPSLLSLSQDHNMVLSFMSASSDFGVFGLITSVTATQTPIPAALPLLASALGGLGFLGWKRRRLA